MFRACAETHAGLFPRASRPRSGPPAPARRARGTGRAGKLPRGPFAGLLALAECSPPRARRCAAAPPRNWPRAAASRRFPPFPARPGQMPPGRRVSRCGRSVPSGCGACARIDSAPGGPDAAHADGAEPSPTCVRGFAARIRAPHPSESARSAPGPRGLRVLRSRPRRPTGGRGGRPPFSCLQTSREAARGAPRGGGCGD